MIGPLGATLDPLAQSHVLSQVVFGPAHGQYFSAHRIILAIEIQILVGVQLDEMLVDFGARLVTAQIKVGMIG